MVRSELRGLFTVSQGKRKGTRKGATVHNRFSCDVTAAMLVYRTIAKKVFWEFDSIIMQNLSDILPLFCTPTWPSHHVSENQEFVSALFRPVSFVLYNFVQFKCPVR